MPFGKPIIAVQLTDEIWAVKIGEIRPLTSAAYGDTGRQVK
jgi:hypothetical protein